MRLLAADIGGTNVRLAYVQDGDSVPVRHDKSYASAEYTGLLDVVEEFLSECAIQKDFDVVCFSIAGPIENGCVDVTNLPWSICEDEIRFALQAKQVFLINDFIAVAYAIPDMEEGDLVSLQEGELVQELTEIKAAVLGAGTGLGAAQLIWQRDHYQAFSSEAGHASFAPETPTQEQLLSWLHKQHAHVSVEMLLSGPGIYTIYQFFRDEMKRVESVLVRDAMQAADPAQVISDYALSGDELCAQTLSCFIEIYGAVAGDIALHYYPLNAVYLAGGIGPKIKDMLASEAFTSAFCNKGPMQENLHRLPIKLILKTNPGLEGAIAYARQSLARS